MPFLRGRTKRKAGRMKEKDYYYTVKVEWGGNMPATSLEQARQRIKDSYEQEYGLKLSDEEIQLDIERGK